MTDQLLKPPEIPLPATRSRSRLERSLAGVTTWSTRHSWLVIAGWVLVVAALGGLAATAAGSFKDDMAAPQSPSTWASTQLREKMPQAQDATARIVARTDNPDRARAAEDAATNTRGLPHVTAADLRPSQDGDVTVIDVRYDTRLADLDARGSVADLKRAAEPLAAAGAEWGVGGEVPESVQGPNGVAEAVGVGVALLVLLLVLRSFRLALLPLVVAAVGVGAGTTLIMLLARVVDLSTVTPTLASMVGIGLAIDYSLLLITRYRRALAAGNSRAEAASEMGATAGRAVLVAGVIVVIGLSGLMWSGVPGFAWMGVGAALVVVTTVVAAVTLVPALLAFVPADVARGRTRPARSATAGRLSAAVVARPLVAAAVGIAVLAALAAPVLGMRLAQNDAGAERLGNPTRTAYDLMADGFGPGANGPFVVVADTSRLQPGDAQALADTMTRDPAVASVTPPQTSPDGDLLVWTALPQWGPQDARTQELATRWRSELPSGVALTGPTAAMLDLTDVLSGNLWRVVLGILLATGVVMLLMFRSLAIPLKAMAANLLSVAGAFGVVTLLFQTSAGASLIGLDGPVPIAAWAPVVLFAILFGLSMDYEVFLVEAIREAYDEHGDNRRAVRQGLAASAGVITAGAAIMIAVAGGFAADPSVMVKLIGVGLATAVILDVTVMRMLVVPAAMTLLGRWNWWLPGSRADVLTPR